MDPSSAALLGGNSVDEDQLDSSRFNVKPSEKILESSPPLPELPKKKPKVITATKVEVKNEQVVVEKPAPVPAPPVEPVKPSIADQMKILILGGNDEEIEE